MDRLQFLTSVSAAAVASSVASGSPLPAAIAGVAIPASPFAKEATAIATAGESPEIFAHSLRTFLFAELVAKASAIQHDAEAVYVASILHDTGLSVQYMSEKRRFEVDGAFVALDLCKKHDVAAWKTGLIWDAIALHDQGDIARFKQPEVALVNAGVATDFGAHLDILKHPDVAAVLAAAPRDRFVPVFLDAVAAYVKRKPFATGNSWITDVGYRMVPGFHVDNFVDAVKSDDPFKDYA
ncbi:MAG: HD domain-containing protein [Candidatus Eremiobacteraeota bacterium]|nr:HD domain-containing protein [Candidatus Eremiobacteraeota bacterium]